jgi:hypothetical protein
MYNKVKRFAVLIPLVLLASLFIPAPAEAQGGIALSGSFYRQAFEIPQGCSVSGPSIYVVVFNNGDEELIVRMSTETPVGVNIILSEDGFTIPPSGQQKVMIGMEVAEDAVPGEYEISITAESYKEGVTGIQLMGAAAQNANLKVVGESALVKVNMANPDGEPVVGTVRLFKVVEGQNYEFAYSDTGELEARVSPGSFIASGYVAGEKLAEETFDIAADEEKTITLTVKTVCFEGFGIVPNYYTETGKLAFAQVVYTLNNLYQTFPEAEVVLKVTFDGTPLEETTIATLTPLEKGSVGLKYNYIPAGGWVDGTYGFVLQLNLEGEPYATTLEEQLNVSGGGVAGASHSRYYIIGGVAAAVIIGVAYFLMKRRKTKASSA